MLKIYYSFDGVSYTFKFYLYETLVVSAIKSDYRIGNKRKSGKNISTMFMKSYLHNSSTGRARKPELELWDKYLSSFWISKGELIEWIDMHTLIDSFYSRILKNLKNKIKDNLQ